MRIRYVEPGNLPPASVMVLDQFRYLRNALRRRDGEESPFGGHALEFVRAALLELES